MSDAYSQPQQDDLAIHKIAQSALWLDNAGEPSPGIGTGAPEWLGRTA
ncbi:hypothetical protein [Bradyrhizobium sp. ISRA464]|nr:hypothetical protein [Bradyrhizobium sp. ISRA464]WGS30179.1 hypothetical protein MTX19_14690 [Bradyrhizobium sp. ISRA464]